jgi:hypothetical protein
MQKEWAPRNESSFSEHYGYSSEVEEKRYVFYCDRGRVCRKKA